MVEAKPTTSQVIYEIRNHTAWLTMSRPESLNALSKAMFSELATGLKKASGDPDIYSIVMTGSGRAFSAGLDIKEVAGFASRREAKEFVYGLVKPFWERYFECDKPVVSIVNGPAYGAGAEIALASDIVIASEGSTFAFSGGRVGALCCISGILGPLTMNGRKVVEMNLTGNTVKAQEAQLHGLVNRVAPPAALGSLAKTVLDEITHVSPISNASFKRIRRSLVTRRSLKVAYDELLRTITSKDFQTGARAFAQKTPAKYYPQA